MRISRSPPTLPVGSANAGGQPRASTAFRDTTMLQAAFAFLILALLAGVLGFSGLAGTSSSIAQILFGVFLVLFLVGLVMGRGRRGAAG